MKTITTIAVLALTLAGCASETTPSSPSTTGPASTITVTVTPPSLLSSGSAVTLNIKATDERGTLTPRAPLTLTTTAGTLSATTLTTSDVGLASVTLTGSEAAAVIISGTGGAVQTNVAAVDPFRVQITGPSSGVAGAPISTGVATPAGAGVINAPTPQTVTLDCGTGDMVTLTGPLTTCRYQSAGTFVRRASATLNGFTASATAPITISAVPAPPPPPPPPPVVARIAIEATELSKTATTATWRFRARPVNGTLSGNLVWFFDYVDPPSSGASPVTLETDDEFEDVTYRATGQKQIRVRGNIGGAEVSAQQTITVIFP